MGWIISSHTPSQVGPYLLLAHYREYGHPQVLAEMLEGTNMHAYRHWRGG